MIHGETEIKFSYESVKEALSDFVQKHFKVGVTVKSWSNVSPVQSYGSSGATGASVLVTLVQRPAPQDEDGEMPS